MIKLSIIVPVYNEEKTVTKTLGKLSKIEIKDVNKEIIIVDDGSIDKTVERIKGFLIKSKKQNIKLIQQAKNQGKGKAVREGISKATGDYIVIQDADLEYDPKYLIPLMEPIKNGRAEVVYGTRLKRLPDLKNDESRPRFLLHYFGNRGLSLILSLLYLTWLTDIETGYKIFPRRVFAKLKMQSTGFEFEPEITSKLLKKGYKIVELPIKTIPRGYEEGKKLNTFSDGTKSLYTIIKYRFVK